MEWSPQQEAALSRVAAWLKAGTPQLFRLFGYAGTGKTTLARHVAEAVEGEVAFGAFTGKAASVLRQKGCHDASTIHSMIYRTRESDEGGPLFAINRSGPASQADLIIIDECSMVDAELGRDLLSFGKPVLVLGDPAQLPPVKGGGFFTDAEPEIMLTEVHRQARDNPIIRLSMTIRDGGRLPLGRHGESRVLSRREIDAAEVTRADQVLVGLNRTRRLYNARIREILGFRDPMPAAGEKLVCLRNDKTKGLLNGGTWTVQALRPPKNGLVRLDLVPEDERRRRPVEVAVLPEFFEGREEEIPLPARRESDEFTYGYALTVHKAQGSQWNDVMLFDESYAFREHRSRWLYTAITRAAERVTVVT
ncbi:MAG: ATP-dependent RecD-like DNA helicase [Microvirga sp.]